MGPKDTRNWAGLKATRQHSYSILRGNELGRAESHKATQFKAPNWAGLKATRQHSSSQRCNKLGRAESHKATQLKHPKRKHTS